MAVTYGAHLKRIWSDALTLPGYNSLVESTAAEVATFVNRPPEEALELMERAWNERSTQMHAAVPRHKAAVALTEYYAMQDAGVLTSAYWHTLLPDNYALHSVSGLQCLQHFAEGNRVFEFGHGIGSAAILLASNGFQVTAGDISEHYRSFARQRVSERNLDVAFIDLLHERPTVDGFDAIVSFDVLEHLPDPVAQIAEMREWLRPGGLLVLNIAFGRDPSNPEHIQPYRLGVMNKIRALGFERISWPTLQVFYKSSVPRARGALYRAIDSVEAARDDATHLVPRLQRVLRSSGNPPLA